jgi:hypothetical protein
MKPSVFNHCVVHIHQPASSGVLLNAEPLAMAMGHASAPFKDRFEVANGMVTDHQLQLMWPVDESEKEMDHDGREKYAADFRLGGFNTWRQPEPWELVASVWDLSRHGPCVNPDLFKSHSGWVGTRQVCAWSPGRVFVVYFDDGNVNLSVRSY